MGDTKMRLANVMSRTDRGSKRDGIGDGKTSNAHRPTSNGQLKRSERRTRDVEPESGKRCCEADNLSAFRPLVWQAGSRASRPTGREPFSAPKKILEKVPALNWCYS